MTPSGDPASYTPISIPTQTALKVLVGFDDGTVLDMSGDSRAVLVPSGSLASYLQVTRDASTNIPSVSATGAGFGVAAVAVSFPAFATPGLTASTAVSVVGYKNGTIVLREYNFPVGTLDTAAPLASNTTTLQKICNPTSGAAYQQATAWQRVALTDDSVYDVTADSNATLSIGGSSPGSITLLPHLALSTLSNRIRAITGGTASLTGTWRGRSTQALPVVIDDSNLAQVTSLTLALPSDLCSDPTSPPLCTQTVQADINSVWGSPLDLVMTLNTPYFNTYTGFTGQARASLYIQPVPVLFSLDSTAPAALAVSTYGDLTLLANGPSGIRLSATYTCGASAAVTSQATAYANLQPRSGDVDLGEIYGPQFQLQPVSSSGAVLPSTGVNFTAGVRVEAGTQPLQSVTVRVSFDSTLLRCVSPFAPTLGAMCVHCTQRADPPRIATIRGRLV